MDLPGQPFRQIEVLPERGKPPMPGYFHGEIRPFHREVLSFSLEEKGFSENRGL